MPRERIPDVRVPEQRILFGPMDAHLRAIRDRHGVRVSSRRGVLLIEGENADSVREVVQRIKAVLARTRSGREPGTEEVAAMLSDAPIRTRGVPSRGGRGKGGGAAPTVARTLSVQPRTEGQRKYIEAIREQEVVIAVGPAGTGKTFLAVSEAVEALQQGRVQRIILTRPAVEAGEKLGFLPGDFQAKINPYLRPLYDALAELLTWPQVQRYINNDVIEIVPLAYMRGRTLKQAFIILDEAQNTTAAQMKMFLTRMGEGSRIVMNGDATQVDLPDGSRSGLVESVRVLRRVPGIAILEFGSEDIIRHALVQRIVDAYERDESWPEAEARKLKREAAEAAEAAEGAEASEAAADPMPEAEVPEEGDAPQDGEAPEASEDAS